MYFNNPFHVSKSNAIFVLKDNSKHMALCTCTFCYSILSALFILANVGLEMTKLFTVVLTVLEFLLL